ncbi:PTS system, galactitol-specific IIC component [Enterococcus sp. AZ089]|jgi:PTS system galactitol-specific IIC component|uniref:PTS galactitol transporter subunit IIC n=1 Tax=unclassified Enterococcus TaxID=2608891 RepID=UPI001129FE6B|nr:PTS transporter subunit IIC [Enterococcus sp. OL5]TPR58438.1 PTS galactitol transporter subunit IIC [Enterococcus sp. OL5]
MEVLANIFQSILDMGAAVFLPIVLTIIGIIVGLKPAKSFSSGLTLGVAFIGISLVIDFMGTTVGTASQEFVTNLGIQLNALDMGWAPALGLAWTWRYAFLMFPVQIGLNILLLIIGWTATLNVDMWNVANKIFTAYIVASVTGNAIIGFAVAIIQIIAELKNADATKNQLQELTGIPGVSMPHPMFLSNIIFYPISRLLDKVPFMRKTVNVETLQEKIGIFGETHVMGFIIGTLVGLFGGQGIQSLMTGVQAGAALTLFPMVSKLFMTALTPISDAANNYIKKKFPGRDLVIGLDWPILAGNSEIWVAIIFTIPVALGLSLILPENIVLPFGNLMNVCVCAAAFISCKGNLKKMLFISWIMVPILLWSASSFAPMLTQLAIDNGTSLPDGQLMAWWGMDISEIRWAIVEALQGNIFGYIGVVGLAILSFFYFKWQKEEEHNAGVRMGIIDSK